MEKLLYNGCNGSLQDHPKPTAQYFTPKPSSTYGNSHWRHGQPAIDTCMIHTMYKTMQLQATIEQIFHDASQHPNTAALIDWQDLDIILAQPLKQLQNWAQ